MLLLGTPKRELSGEHSRYERPPFAETDDDESALEETSQRWGKHCRERWPSFQRGGKEGSRQGASGTDERCSRHKSGVVRPSVEAIRCDTVRGR
jgi:hypothetical protein